MAVFSYETELSSINFSSNLEERDTHAYNESSAIYVVDDDYGNIVANVDIDEDYGSILDTNITGWKLVDYGFITVNETLVPYGSIEIGNNDFANLRLVKIGLNKGVTFSILGEARAFVTPIEIGSGFIKIKGTSGDPIFNLAHIGSGSLFGFSSTTESFGSNPPESIALFKFTGSAVEKNTESYIGTGSLFGFSSATESTLVSPESSVLFKFSGSSTSIFELKHFGTGSLFSFRGLPLEEKNIYSYNESSAIYVVDEDYGNIVANVDVDEDYGFISNELLTGWDVKDYGFITTNQTLIPYGSIEIGNNDFANLRLVKIGLNKGVTFSILGEARIFTTPIEIGSGFIKIKGTSGDPVFNLAHIGSGSLFGFSSATESFGSNPPESTALFKFTGSAVEKNTESYIGTGSLFGFVGFSESTSNVEKSQGLFKFSGSSTSIFELKHFGTGSLFSFRGLPLEEKNTHSYNESSAIYIIDEDYGNIVDNTNLNEDYGFISNELLTGWDVKDYGFITTNQTLIPYGSIEIGNNDFSDVSLIKIGLNKGVTFSILGEARIFTTPIEIGSGSIKIKGTSGDPVFNLAHIGSGSLFGFSSTTESISTNPPESIALFKFTGSAVEKNTESYIGTGSLFGFSSATESISNVEKSQGLFKFSGSVKESFIPAPHIGSGSLFGFSSTTESTLVSLQSFATFRFTGNLTESKTKAYIGYVQIDIEGSVDTIFKLSHIGSVKIDIEGAVSESISPSPHIGSGTLFAFTGSSESISANPPESTALFRVTGLSNYNLTSAYNGKVVVDVEGAATTIFKLGHIGSGALRAFSSTTESTLVSPKSSVLFKFSGNLAESKTKVYLGSGSLFGFSSATESTLVSPESSVLFKFSGSVKESFIPAPHIGSGALRAFSSTTESTLVSPKSSVLFKFSGNLAESKTKAYIGSGSLFGFSSATESISNVEKSQGLFKFTGSVKESFIPAPHIAVGSLFAFGSATETRSVSPQVFGVFTFTGSVVEKKSRSYVGSGSLFGFSSTTESFAITPSTFAPLFKISGVVAESFIPAPHIGFGSFRTLSGAAETRSVSPKVSVLFEFYGNNVERSTRSQLGSGSLFGITGSNDASVVIPKIAGVLFNLFGDVRERFIPSGERGSGMVLLRGVSLNRKVTFVPAKPSRIILI